MKDQKGQENEKRKRKNRSLAMIPWFLGNKQSHRDGKKGGERNDDP